MKNRQHDYISSRQSPYLLPYKRRYKESLYSHMFLEDFSRCFSSEFSPIGERGGFYNITPENNTLKELLLFSDYLYFDYSFDELLSEVVYYLLINGKTYIEIVSFTNQESIVKGIEFVCVPAKCCGIRLGKYNFVGQNRKNEVINFDIDMKRLVIFDLKDIGFHRNFFRKMINHLSIFDTINAFEFMHDPKMKGVFDFEVYQKHMEYKLLKDTKSIHWLGRNYSNQHLSESYHLYRFIQYKALRYRFLQYILDQINVGLDKLKSDWDFVGNISAPVSLLRYEEAFKRYSKGEINASTLGDIVIKNLITEGIKKWNYIFLWKKIPQKTD